MQRAQLTIVALAFVAGVASDASGVDVAVLGASLAAVLLVRTVPAVVRANALAALALGILDGLAFGHPAPQSADVRFQHLDAIVIDARASDLGRSEAVLRLADGALATVSLPGAAPAIGARLIVRAKRALFDEPRNPGEPSLREIERDRGIGWHLERPRVLQTRPPDPSDATLWLPRLRAWASQRLHATLGEPEATILAGAMWGERGTLPPALRDEFQDTGTVHVLVTAGLHLGVVAALALALLHGLRFGRASASLGAIPLVWTYAALSGAPLPSVRAATMLTFGLLARAAGREALSWNALGAAAIVVVALHPASVTSVSFALSFSCVAAIFAFATPLARACERCAVPPWAAGAVGVSLATQLGTWPLTAAAFLTIAPYAPLANLLVVPVVAVAMLVGFVALGCADVPLVGAAANNVETSLLQFVIFVVRAVGSLPGAHVVATPPPWWAIVAYDAACVVAARALTRGRIALALCALAATTALCLWPPRAVAPRLVVTAIDVGQADALLVRTPRGHAYLVDAGGRLERGPARDGVSAAEDVGTRVVVPFLIRSGIHRLDAILASHPHGDHVGGVAPALRTLGAGGFADSGQAYPGHAYRDALAEARARGVPMLEPRGGSVWRTDDGVTFRFYGPTYPYVAGGRNDINDNSLVFRLEYGGFRMLFTGDAGETTERRLLASGADLRADVLKVGHHGSAYGTTPAFVAAVRPTVAVISVGRNNLFGHPAPSTLATLARSGARVFRTDRSGAIVIGADGPSYRVEPYRAP
ncbi:MAG: DNA internalization-related competence protein ComEC/Rec2 [Vulcanimicrobiaceae bacterium]